MRILFLMFIAGSLSLASDVFVDSKTGLMWQDNSDAKYIQKDWNGAMLYCRQLRLAGHDDWRLPSIKELKHILSTEPRDGGMKKGFNYMGGSGYYWSSSENESNEEFAWMMNFKRGYEYSNYKSYERHIRCVRDIQ
ncbi:DUF1566 domain-containing protein [Sulfurovum lithotrophicum]|uniref:Lcl C-terminal domain-containing protein n=1 Tax=Sulfurovum lithotrophicum TaxID=206403 RepID=UPI00069676C6|nr:DUF1566 domain-containing protein [Sulfurovum lithotrophicum]